MRSEPPGAFPSFPVFNQRNTVRYSFRKTRQCSVDSVVDDRYLSRLETIFVTACIKVQEMLQFCNRHICPVHNQYVSLHRNLNHTPAGFQTVAENQWKTRSTSMGQHSLGTKLQVLVMVCPSDSQGLHLAVVYQVFRDTDARASPRSSPVGRKFTSTQDKKRHELPSQW